MNSVSMLDEWMGSRGGGGKRLLVFRIFLEQLSSIFEEADEHDHGGTRKSDEEHHFKEPYYEKSKHYAAYCSVFPARAAV
jgi:hypothetical protein